MTKILQQKKDLKDKIALHTKEQYDADVSIFDGQQEALQNIMNTEGFRNIKEFWIKQEMTAIKELGEVDPEDKYEVAKTQAKFNMANKFNTYLNTRIK